MAIHHLTGYRLKRAILAGSESVMARTDHLNRINVFPVADGDTGTNMALTLKSIAEGLYDCDDASADAVAQCAADSALVGSRGNSGSILAQFYQGLSEGIAGRERLDAKDFADAAVLAKDFAYDSMMEPKEGTILTVIRDWSTSFSAYTSQTKDFRELFTRALTDAKTSLARTPELLKVNGEAILKKAGVVDSGAQGFVDMLEGVLGFINRGNFREFIARKFFAVSDGAAANVEANADAITFQYCTEFVLENGAAYDKKNLRKELIELGDSLIIGGSSTKTKVHLHTNVPQTVFDIAAKFGTVIKTKYEDMKAQNEAAFGKKAAIGIITDSTCDLSDEYLEAHDVRMVPLQVRFGEDEFLDRVTISPQEFYTRLAASKALPKTSQPATANFKQVYEDALRSYSELISIHISSGISGTFQNARTSTKFFKGKKIVPVDSKLTSLGQGFLVREAVEMRDKGEPIDRIASRLNEMATKIKIFISLETIENLVKGGRLSAARGFIAKLLRINPVLTFDEKGKVVQAAKGMGQRGALEKAIDLTLQHVAGKKTVRIGLVYADKTDGAEYARVRLAAACPEAQIEVTQISPVLGTYGGSGTTAFLVFAE